MWGIKFGEEQKGEELPLITYESLAGITAVLLILRIVIHSILERWFCIRNIGKEHEVNSLEYSYFYHLSIIILLLSDVNWNLFDLSLWLISYICIGMVRKALHIVKVERDIILNDYSYNNKIIVLLSSSQIYGLTLFIASLFYYFWINYSFLGVQTKVTSLLCFPILMLVIDSSFMFLCSWMISKNLLCFFNPNINQIPPAYKYEMIYKISASSVKIWHFYNLLVLFIRTVLSKMQFFDCMWILSVANAFYSSVMELLRSVKKYRSYVKLQKSMDKIFLPHQTAKDQACVICMESLFNCRKLVNCGHLFHYKCLFQWVQTKCQCPVCRVQINLNV